MTRHKVGLSLLVALSLGACEAPPPGAPQATTSAMEFRGDRPCVDCDGISAWLRLEQGGKGQRYRLTEAYRSSAREREFVDEGDWQSQGDLLRLRSAAGGERVYQRLADGTLQARDAHGRPLPAADDEVMVPVTFDSAH